MIINIIINVKRQLWFEKEIKYLHLRFRTFESYLKRNVRERKI